MRLAPIRLPLLSPARHLEVEGAAVAVGIADSEATIGWAVATVDRHEATIPTMRVGTGVGSDKVRDAKRKAESPACCSSYRTEAHAARLRRLSGFP